MSVFVMGDLHLSTLASTNKSMEVFGRRWSGYIEKISKNWTAVVNSDDTVIVPGDISWALSLEEAESDLKFINALPGKKIFLKGNHDFWWSTRSKMNAFFEKNEIKTIDFLYNNAMAVEDFILCGSRGWYQDNDNEKARQDNNYEKIIARECIRLRLSLDEGKKLKNEHPDKELVVFMHFPPFWNRFECREFIDVLKEYGVKRCYFGHIHGNYTAPKYVEHEGIEFIIVSADYLEFTPRLILPQ